MRKLIAVLVLGLAGLIPAVAQEAGDAPPAGPTATLTLTRGAPGEPSLFEVALEPKDATTGELFISLYQGRQHIRRGLRPVEPGHYQLDVDLPAGGTWGIYLRYGPGQAGYFGYSRIDLPDTPGESARASTRLISGFARDVPSYVQPLGFLAFALILLLTLAGLVTILRWIARQQRLVSPHPLE